MQSIVVLLDKLTCRVDDAASKVLDEEAFVVADLAVRLELGSARHVQAEVLRMLGVNLGCEVIRARCRQFALFVQQVEDTCRFGFNQVDAVLVVYVANFAQAEAFFVVYELLLFEILDFISLFLLFTVRFYRFLPLLGFVR